MENSLEDGVSELNNINNKYKFSLGYLLYLTTAVSVCISGSYLINNFVGYITGSGLYDGFEVFSDKIDVYEAFFGMFTGYLFSEHKRKIK